MTYQEHAGPPATVNGFNTLAGIDYQQLSQRGHKLRSQAISTAVKAAFDYLKNRLIQPLRHRYEAYSTYRALMSLDNRALQDIGISRSDIRAIATGTWDCPAAGSVNAATPRVRCVVNNRIKQTVRMRANESLQPLAA